MKKTVFVLSIISVLIIWSLSYKETKKERLQNAISEFNKNIKSSDIITYYPETYTEIKTDSIIANTFKVSIKNYSANNESIMVRSSTDNNNVNRDLHRIFQSEIHVQVSDRMVYQKQLKATDFDPNTDPDFWNNATLEHVWINQWRSNSSTLAINVSFLNPLENTFMLYEIHIDTEGNESKRLIDQNS